MQQTYTYALLTIWKGIRIFTRCWAETLNRLLHDLLHGICRHWFFTIVLIAAFVAMFVTMGKARVERDNVSMTNYQLSQTIDSLKLLKQ